jgi:hypothetical protein
MYRSTSENDNLDASTWVRGTVLFQKREHIIGRKVRNYRQKSNTVMAPDNCTDQRLVMHYGGVDQKLSQTLNEPSAPPQCNITLLYET